MLLCPNCNKNPLYLVIEQRITLSVASVGFQDVFPEQKLDEEGVKILECLECGWRGWTEDYHQAKNGVVKMLCRYEEGKPL